MITHDTNMAFMNAMLAVCFYLTSIAKTTEPELYCLYT